MPSIGVYLGQKLRDSALLVIEPLYCRPRSGGKLRQHLSIHRHHAPCSPLYGVHQSFGLFDVVLKEI